MAPGGQPVLLPARAPAAVAMFATDSANISHVSSISADGQASFAGDLSLLLGAHGGEPASAFLLPPGPGISTGSAAGRLAPLTGAACLGRLTLAAPSV